MSIRTVLSANKQPSPLFVVVVGALVAACELYTLPSQCLCTLEIFELFVLLLELCNTALSVEENIVKMCYLSKIVKIIKTNYFVLMVSLQKYYLNLSLMNKINE